MYRLIVLRENVTKTNIALFQRIYTWAVYLCVCYDVILM